MKKTGLFEQVLLNEGFGDKVVKKFKKVHMIFSVLYFNAIVVSVGFMGNNEGFSILNNTLTVLGLSLALNIMHFFLIYIHIVNLIHNKEVANGTYFKNGFRF